MAEKDRSPIQNSSTSAKDTVDSGNNQKSIPLKIAERFIETEEVLLGDIVVEEDLRMTQLNEVKFVEKVSSFAEIMPEFIGGIDSLKAFISVNLKYPEWERKNKIEGTVYVSFTIDEDGRVKDASIVKSVEQAKDFDSEVLRVIDMMPNWKPGRDGGENVAVQFVIPIKFVL